MLRAGFALIVPFLPEVGHTSGLWTAYNDGIPTIFAQVVAVSPFANDQQSLLPKEGDMVIFRLYSSQQLNVPCLGEEPHDPNTHRPMRSTTLGMHVVNLSDIEAILDFEDEIGDD